MQPYGVRVIEYPDVADLQSMGAKSSAGQFPGPGGDYRGYSRTANKRKARRYWKRRARRQGRADCRPSELDQFQEGDK